MTDTYLEIIATGVLDTSGHVVVAKGPDVGQYWKPTLVHVANQSGIPQQAFLYSGGTPGTTLASYLKDSTFQAQNDSSSILSGTIIQYGQGITCQFIAGQPGDVVTMQIFGISSDTPPPLGILPSVPGVRFSGAFAGETNPPLFINTQINSAAPGTLVQFPPSGTNSGFYTGGLEALFVAFDAFSSGAARLSLFWSTDQAGNMVIAEDVIDESAAIGNGFGQSIPVKGPWMRASIQTHPSLVTSVIATVGAMFAPSGISGNANTPNGAIMFGNPVFAVAPGTHQVATLGGYGGMAAVQGFSRDGTNWTIEMHSVSYDGTIDQLIWLIDQRRTTQATDLIYIPPGIINVFVTNGDAANHNYTLVLSHAPFFAN